MKWETYLRVYRLYNRVFCGKSLSKLSVLTDVPALSIRQYLISVTYIRSAVFCVIPVSVAYSATWTAVSFTTVFQGVSLDRVALNPLCGSCLYQNCTSVHLFVFFWHIISRNIFVNKSYSLWLDDRFSADERGDFFPPSFPYRFFPQG
jgi:hypothetical protein